MDSSHRYIVPASVKTFKSCLWSCPCTVAVLSVPVGGYTCRKPLSSLCVCGQAAVKQESGDPCKDAKYLEPDIDSIRVLKDEVSMSPGQALCTIVMHIHAVHKLCVKSVINHITHIHG